VTENQPKITVGAQPAAGPGESLAWPLEAARVSLDDPLMECLAIVAADHGRRTTAAALSAGLPIHGQQMATPAAFVRAADRISMTARMVRRPLKDILQSPNLPCILVLKRNQACILRGPAKNGVEVIFPETPDAPVVLSETDLQARYGDYAFFVRPSSTPAPAPPKSSPGATGSGARSGGTGKSIMKSWLRP
jgi:ABC-type bacteriocin/lantibiotic exporter with double-glycine peptidase domain